ADSAGGLRAAVPRRRVAELRRLRGQSRRGRHGAARRRAFAAAAREPGERDERALAAAPVRRARTVPRDLRNPPAAPRAARRRAATHPLDTSRQEYERPDMVKCETHDAYICSLDLSTDKVGDHVLPARVRHAGGRTNRAGLKDAPKAGWPSGHHPGVSVVELAVTDTDEEGTPFGVAEREDRALGVCGVTQQHAAVGGRRLDAGPVRHAGGALEPGELLGL